MSSRETVGVVELECHLAGQCVAGVQRLERFLEQLVTGFQRAPEPALFAFGHVQDAVPLLDQVRIGNPHRIDGGVDQHRHDCVLRSEQHGVTHRSSQ